MNIKISRPIGQISKACFTSGKIRLIGSILLFLTLALSVVAAYEFAYWQKIYPGASIAQIPVGNLTKQEAQLIIQQALAQKKPRTLKLVWDSQSWEIDLEELGLVYQPEKTVNQTYTFGRDKNPITNSKIRYQAWTKSQNFGLDYSLNQELLKEKIATLSSQIFIPAIPPLISAQSKPPRIVVSPGSNGQELESEKLFALIDFQLANLVDNPIVLPIRETSFAINQETLEKTKTRAEALLPKKLILKTDNKTKFEIDGEETISFISFKNDFEEEKIKEHVAQVATLINQTPQDALFRFENGRVIAFQPEKPGTLIDQTKTVQLIKEGLDDLEGSEENEKSIELPVRFIGPKIKIGDINRFGIVEEIGNGKSSFKGSASERIHNIQLASAKLSGILVPPGGIFSFNQSLGEVSEKTGFKQAYIIKEGRTILGDGGGVCQVSTTLFRAVLNTGLPILERHAHAYRVYYYEQDSQPGFDATVFDPTADLKFKNDTPAYILVQPTVNTKTQTLVFEIYGTNDGRRISLSKTRVWDQIPPPPDLYQDNPALPAGTIKQIDWKAWGAKVAFDWKVTRNGEVLQDRTFYSTYHPWQAIFSRGTGPP